MAFTAPDRGHRFGPFSEYAAQYPVIGRMAGFLIWPMGLATLFPVYRFLVEERQPVGTDSHAYWLALQGPLSYTRVPGEIDAYLYSPAFLSAIRPLGVLPWPVFEVLWILLESAVLFWLLRPLRPTWAIPLFVAAIPELIGSNIFLFLAAAAVVAARAPGVWAFGALTKVATGVGLLWPLARGDWKSFGVGAGTTVAIFVAGYAIDPGAWNAWFEFLLSHRSGTPDSTTNYVIRTLLAVGLVVLGARLNWSFLLAPAMFLATPVLAGMGPLALFLMIPRLLMADGAAAPLAPHVAESTQEPTPQPNLV
ncbi:hypothetical protein J2W20_000589 [Sinomonas atrocyanea]|uniref:glycosyltransferase family 87 protein n=1 Tax=Sinomonas atrocyanea TaxID=37927 RepID=UPI002780F1FB|nr:glycosyltransferase family 87 protein [Sinomonas atrocyanea]MDQ0258714.1 hypothetical protein [Sinomonas atrocyanea]